MNHPTRMNFPALAESAIQKHSPFLHLEFHPAAVAALDEFFTVTWGESGLDNGQSSWTPTQGQRVAIVELGVFFGELVRRYFGGHWQEDVAQPERLLLASVGLPKGVQVFPVHHAWQRLQRGAGSNFQDLFAQVRAHLGVIPSPSEADGWLGQAKVFERTGRVDIASRFYEQALLLRPDAAVRAHLGLLRAASAAPPAAETVPEAPELPAVNDAAKILASAITLGKSLLEQRAMWTNRGAMTLANMDLLVTDLFGAKPRATGFAWTEDQLALGAFIGEMYCRRFGGRWLVVSSTPMTQWHLTWPSGITVNPFQILETRLNLGSETTILSQVAKSLRPLLKNGEAEDPPEVPGELAAQAEDFAKDPKRLAWALQFGKAALLDGLPGAGFRVRVARWARALKQLNDAAEQLHAAAEIEPQNYAIALEQAEVASAQANRTAAEQHARRATTLRPDRPGPWFALAAAQVALEQYGPAIDSYKRAITLAPERAADLAESLRHLEALKTDAEDPLF